MNIIALLITLGALGTWMWGKQPSPDEEQQIIYRS